MKRILFVFLCLLTAGFAVGPYYISFTSGSDSNNGTTTGTPWKRAPGMTGFTGTYSHTAGDVFYFQLGDTWTSGCFPWTIAASGTSGNVDTYTTLSSWGSGAQPIFDANHTEPAGGMLQLVSRSFVKINNLHLTNYATTGVAEFKKGIVWTDCHDLQFTNNTLDLYCWISIYAVFDVAGTYSNFTVTGNDCSHTSGLLWFASAAASITRANLNISNNVIHDFSSQLGGVPGNDVHGDGLLHTFSVPAADVTQPVTGLVCANNEAYGDFRRGFGTSGAMTAFFFTEDNVTGLVYNNSFHPSPVQASMFDGFMVLGTTSGSGSSSNLGVYNNTLDNPGTSSASAGIHIVDKGTYILKNNLCTGLSYSVYNEITSGSYTYDYDLWNSGNSQLVFGASFQSYATWQAASRDVHGVLGTAPTFVSAPTNVALATGSAGIGVGVDLSAIFTTDINGVTRTAPWDMGAYKYGGAATRIKSARFPKKTVTN